MDSTLVFFCILKCYDYHKYHYVVEKNIQAYIQSVANINNYRLIFCSLLFYMSHEPLHKDERTTNKKGTSFASVQTIQYVKKHIYYQIKILGHAF